LSPVLATVPIAGAVYEGHGRFAGPRPFDQGPEGGMACPCQVFTGIAKNLAKKLTLANYFLS
jgi:hypothetical protein